MAKTTLNGAINDSVTSLTPTSLSFAPTAPQFKILIDSELMLVTGVSGTTYTVTRNYNGTTAAAHSNGATIWHAGSPEFSGVTNVKEFGAKGDAVTDDTADIQAAINAAPRFSILYFPPGWYIVTSTLTFVLGKSLIIRGAGRPFFTSASHQGGTLVYGVVNAPIFDMANPQTVTVEDIHVQNAHASGTCIRLEGGSLAEFNRVWLTGFKGLITEHDVFMLTLRTVNCSHVGNPAGSIGAALQGHVVVSGFEAIGHDHALRLFTFGGSVHGLRIETCSKGLVLGMDYTGATNVCRSMHISGIGMEANNVGIEIKHCSHSLISGVSIQGSTSAPSGQSQIGIDAETADRVEFVGILAGGSFDDAAIRADGDGHQRWRASDAVNGFGGASKTWDIINVNAKFDNCNTAIGAAQIGTRAKIGATAGWVLAAADNLPYVATLPASQSGSTLVIPVDGLRIGDTIEGFRVVAQVESAGGTVTMDAILRAVTNIAAEPTDAAIGSGITQVSVTADTAVSAVKTGLTEVVTSGKSYYLLLTATTAASTDIIVQHCEITTIAP